MCSSKRVLRVLAVIVQRQYEQEQQYQQLAAHLLVDCDCVEVVHFDIAVWPDGVGHGASILTKLAGTQDGNILQDRQEKKKGR